MIRHLQQVANQARSSEDNNFDFNDPLALQFDARGQHQLPVLGENSSRTCLELARSTDLQDETTVRGRKLMLARQRQKDIKTIRLVKLFVSVIFTASNQFALDEKQC